MASEAKLNTILIDYARNILLKAVNIKPRWYMEWLVKNFIPEDESNLICEVDEKNKLIKCEKIDTGEKKTFVIIDPAEDFLDSLLPDA